MNMVLHGIEHANIAYRDSLPGDHARDRGAYFVVLVNPPFAGSRRQFMLSVSVLHRSRFRSRRWAKGPGC